MRRGVAKLTALAAAFLGLTPAPAHTGGEAPPRPAAAQAEWTPDPWLADLAEMRTAFETKYANLDWLLTEREFDLNGLFDRAAGLLRTARSDAEAVTLFNRIVDRINDGHVSISWPAPQAKAAPAQASAASVANSAPVAPPTAASFCRALGYQPGIGGTGIGPLLAGYSPIASGDVLPAGTVQIGSGRAGIIRIGIFDPHGSLSLCEEAVKTLSIPLDRKCDSTCEDAILTRAYRRLTAALEDRLTALRAAKADVLIVDIAGNGGGSEWTEAAARMLSPRPLTSARMGFVRGPHWERLWREQAERLRGFAAAAPAKDRVRLLGWAAEAEKAKAEAARRCPPTGDPACSWLGRAGFSTGLVGRVKAGEFLDKDWGVHVFNPGQHPYRDGVWDGPVIVLTDEETWSAAEQFAALLQDNRAALIVGSRTGGSGCGHTWGGTPTRLSNSGATLKLPDCARFRADGSNEVRGIMPDLAVPWRANDGKAFRARLLQAALPEAAARARLLHRRAETSPRPGSQRR